MITEHPEPAPESATAAEQDGEAPIVSLDQVRARRQQQQAQEAAAQAARQKELFDARQDLQRAVLQRAIADRRLLFSDFVDLIKLGIVTDDEDHLPCEVHSRDCSYWDWESTYYGEEQADPDEDLVDDLLQRLRKAGVDGYEVNRIAEGRRKKVPPPNTVICPMYAYGENEDPPCVKALNERYTRRFEDGEMKQYRILPDPDDPVVQVNLHPCVFLGRELFRSVLPGAWELAAQEGEAQVDEEEED